MSILRFGDPVGGSAFANLKTVEAVVECYRVLDRETRLTFAIPAKGEILFTTWWPDGFFVSGTFPYKLCLEEPGVAAKAIWQTAMWSRQSRLQQMAVERVQAQA